MMGGTMHRENLPVWVSKERKGVVKEEATGMATSSYLKCEMSKVLGAHSRLGETGGREEVVQRWVCDWLAIERS